MTDPRAVLRASGLPAPDVDLAAVHTRAAQLRRRRRAGSALAGVLVVAGAGGLLALPGGPHSEQLVPPVAAPVVMRGPTAPAATPPGDPAPTPAPTPRGTVQPTTPPSAGTGSGRTPTAGPSTTRTPSTTATSAFPAEDQPDASDGTGGGLVLTGVTIGRQNGYDRVVYRFEGPDRSLPGWRVSYVDEPVQDGSGERVALAGAAYLEVVLTGTTYEMPPGTTPYVGRQAPSGLPLVREVVTGGPFEGQAQSFMGLQARMPFRVFRLTGPTRVVVDVRTS